MNASDEDREHEPSLGDRLAAYVAKLRANASPFIVEYDRIVERLRAGAAGDGAPGVGDVMPPFMLADQRGRLTTLEELLEAGPLVVSFNRGHWCPFCRIELTAFDEAFPEIERLGACVVSIMPERQPFTRIMASSLAHPMLILSDVDNDYALELGLVMWVGEPLRALMEGRPAYRIDEFQGSSSWMLPLPATFVVGRDGRVRARYVNPDFRERMEIGAALQALREA